MLLKTCGSPQLCPTHLPPLFIHNHQASKRCPTLRTVSVQPNKHMIACLGASTLTSEVVETTSELDSLSTTPLEPLEPCLTTTSLAGRRVLDGTNNILPLPASLAHDIYVQSTAKTYPVEKTEITTTQPTTSEPTEKDNVIEAAKAWALLCLAVSYVHQAATSTSLPAMLPMISEDLGLSDLEGAWLTSGYAYLYATALIPVGILADKLPRNKLLAAGTTLWSLLSILSSHAHSFHDLLGARIGFAAAQATQNPVSFSLIPDLFPKRKSTAMAVYNTAIYVGRALSFACVILASKLGMHQELGSVAAPLMVPLDDIDYQNYMILYTRGDMAAVTPLYDYVLSIDYGTTEAAWRKVLQWLALPGFAIATAMFFTVKDPRHTAAEPVATPPQEKTADATKLRRLEPAQTASLAPASSVTDGPSTSQPSMASNAAGLFKSSAFLAVTAAASLNDFASYSLIAFQSTFFERVLHVGSADYAPWLVGILPIGGILGGIGGGMLADALGPEKGGRRMATAGASMLAAPFFAAYIMSSDIHQTYAALLVGFAMSEAWRAPGAVMIRTIAPPSLGSTASAIYLSIRNLVGGLGPLFVAKLAEGVGLQKALLLSPAMYMASGMVFLWAEKCMRDEQPEPPRT